MQLTTYLNFGGNCEDAFTFYEQHLGGKINFLMRHGDSPVMPQVLDDFRLRRVSVSFRFVPEQHIKSLREFSAGAQQQIRGYVEQLAGSSAHFKLQLEGAPLPDPLPRGETETVT